MHYYTLEDYLRRQSGVKLFISWSGDKSKEVAELLHRWLRYVIQALEPWVSTEDIETGAVWFTKICEEIKEVCNSIIVVTKENKEKPWIMFEAGALCKGEDANRVNILLVDVEPNEIRQPLASFNMAKANKDGLRKLIHSLYKRLLDEENDKKTNMTKEELDHLFDTLYPEFERKFSIITEKYPQDNTEEEPKSEIKQMQEEILLAIRGMEKTLLDTKNQVALNTASKVVSDIIMAAVSNTNSNPTIHPYLHQDLRSIKSWRDFKVGHELLSDKKNMTSESE